ncbi:hypothetical protein [Dyadobacter sp. 3J3]|uniref:hypothetical protein n=1 Tax=Dyadobacter sp. 3J3 TaxID=2606600 RepID=UPI00135B14FC|nr:hypothetical protein [Dyadobacter sp. 3J3]
MNWLKETGDGFLRSADDVNRRRQDGFKSYMLCANCEDRFGKLETYVAKSIFHPVVNDSVTEFKYDERLFKFVISVFWRTLHHGLLQEEKQFSTYPYLLEAEKQWKNYLLDNGTLERFNKLHLLIGVDVMRNTSNLEKEITDRAVKYMARNIDSGVIDDGNTYHVAFLKIPRFLFIIPVSNIDEKQFTDTEIFISGGSYRVNDGFINDPNIGYTLLDRINQLENALGSMSQAQKQKIEERTLKKWGDVKNKDLGQILEYLRDKSKNK